MKSLIFFLTFLFGACPAFAADAQLGSWQTGNSRRYARVYESDAAKATGTSITTWSRGAGTQSSPSYAGVIQVSYSANWVYLRTTGLGYHVMGPWYANASHTQNFPNFPANQGVLVRFPRVPMVATTRTLTPGGPIGYFVDGVAVFDNRDTFSYTNASAADAGPGGGGGAPGGMPPGPGGGSFGDGVWNRDAYVNEGMTFDPAFAHQAGSNYHYHANTPVLRYQFGDHVDYNANTKTYTESTTTATAHSPILGWMADGYPVYGPYGYASPMNASSGVRRMIPGYVKRDGTNGTTNLNTAGRTTLPDWAARAQNRSVTLTSNVYGPAVSSTYVLGHYLEDYDYLGNLGKTQGTDFDLNECNVRFCLTPEFPNGTYAYFMTIEADGTPKFPYIIGRWFYGAPTGTSITAITESVTEYVRVSQASAIQLVATRSGASVILEWTSVEGATYKMETSTDGTTWSNLANAAALTSSGGETTNHSTATLATYYRVTLTALATYDTRGAAGISGVGNTAASGISLGSTGAARLTNIATRVELGGRAGTPISGFVLNGTGTKSMLVRAVGPGLAPFGVTAVLADPRLSLLSGAATVASNDNWLSTDAATMAASGAFALTAGSKDAAFVAPLSAGAYTAPMTASDGGSGVALLEVYDAASSSQLSVVNASTRAYVGTDASVLIPGFTVSGAGSLRLLIRAVGPSLAKFGVSDTLADPTITLYRNSSVLASNDNWSSGTNTLEIASVSAAVGAFALNTNSKDAALLVSLAEGSYTAVVSGVGSTTGTALVELYVVP